MKPPTLAHDLEQKCVNTIRFLAVDAVEKAKSGHPGGVMGAADAAFVLWHDFLRHDPSCPQWPARDRFVLSAGHMSMLPYALLHLTGYGLTLEEIKQFRQLGSRTPGHPEFGVTPGVEVTAGPLGAGFANAVGMALAARMAGARFHDERGALIDSRVFVLASDGDLMEGVSAEAASLAGHLRLGNLVCIWDDNKISIDGPTGLAFSEDVLARFEGHGFRTARVDGHDRAALRAALSAAMADSTKPTIIASRTRIAYGSPGKENTSESHGAPLGTDETRATKRALGWPEDAQFLVPADVREVFLADAAHGLEKRRAWDARVQVWLRADEGRAREWERFWAREVPGDLFERLAAAVIAKGPAPTRKLSQACLQEAAKRIPAIVGGSADLTDSNSVGVKGGGTVGPATVPDPAQPDPAFAGRNIHFGVREHAMGSIVNGMTLFGGFRPYAATYLVFSDYLRPALRLAALMEIPATYVFSHDSFRVGEDGPTHQPIEQLWAIRAIPRLAVYRPADALETAAAWSHAAGARNHPVAIVVTRQNVTPLERPAGFSPDLVRRGGYLLVNPGSPDLAIVATGSEVALAVEAAGLLGKRGVRARIVSMPCMEIWDDQDESYRRSVLPPGMPIVTLEAGATFGWYRFTGRGGLAIGIDRFGSSAPYKLLEETFGFTPEAVCTRILEWWKSNTRRGNDAEAN